MKREKTRSVAKWVLPSQLVLVIALLGGWQVGAAVGVIDPFFFSSPNLVLARLWRLLLTGTIWQHVWTTFFETIVGFLLGGSLGIGMGLIIGSNSFLNRVTNPFVFFFYSLPRIALAPLFIVILGLGSSSKIATVAFTIFFILLINTIAGVNNIQPLWVDSARIMGASPRQISLRIVLPGVLVWVFTGLRVAVSLAFAAAIVAEFSGATSGVGYELLFTSSNFDTTGVMAWMIVLGILALSLNILVELIESRLLSWRPQVAGW